MQLAMAIRLLDSSLNQSGTWPCKHLMSALVLSPPPEITQTTLPFCSVSAAASAAKHKRDVVRASTTLNHLLLRRLRQSLCCAPRESSQPLRSGANGEHAKSADRCHLFEADNNGAIKQFAGQRPAQSQFVQSAQSASLTTWQAARRVRRFCVRSLAFKSSGRSGLTHQQSSS